MCVLCILIDLTSLFIMPKNNVRLLTQLIKGYRNDLVLLKIFHILRIEHGTTV